MLQKKFNFYQEDLILCQKYCVLNQMDIFFSSKNASLLATNTANLCTYDKINSKEFVLANDILLLNTQIIREW